MATYQAVYSGNWSTARTWGHADEDCITDGGFDDTNKWSKSASTVSSGKLRFTSAVNGAYGQQNTSTTGGVTKILQAGRTYTVTFTVDTLSAGNVRAYVGGTYGTTRTTTGTFTQDIVAGGTNSVVGIYTLNGLTTAVIDNLSVYLKTEAIPPAGSVSTIIISAGVNVLMDENRSGTASDTSLTIQGGDPPGMLYFKDGTSGSFYANNYLGTTGTYKGRILVNSDGVWENTGALSTDYYAYIYNAGGANTYYIDCTYLDIRLYCGQIPTLKYVRSYGTKYEFTASESTVDVVNNTLNLGTTPPADTTAVRVVSRGGTLPEPLNERDIYFVYGRSGNTCKLVYKSATVGTLVDLTTTGSGQIALVTGHTSTSTGTFNILDDVTTDPVWQWATTTTSAPLSALYDIMVVDVKKTGAAYQRAGLSSLTSSTLTINVNNNAARYPCSPLVLLSRNVVIAKVAGDADQSAFVNLHSGCILSNCAIQNVYATSINGRCIGPGSAGYTLEGVVMSCFLCGTNQNWSGGTFSNCMFSGIDRPIQESAGIKLINGSKIIGAVYVMLYGTFAMFETGTEVQGIGIFHCGGVSGGHWSSSQNIIAADITGAQYLSYQPGGSYDDMYVDFRYSGRISGSQYGFSQVIASHGLYLTGATFVGCDSVITGGLPMIASNTTFLGCETVMGAVAETSYGAAARKYSYKHNGTANDTRMWSSAGTATPEASVVPAGKTYSYKFTFANDSYPCMMEWYIDRPANASISVTVHANNYTTGLTEDQRLHWALVDSASDPLIDHSATYLDSFTTDDTDVWQSDTLRYTKVDDRPIILRVWAYRASGNAYAYCGS